jgi:hypothetical protein
VPIQSIFSCMVASIRLGLRTASICLLGVAASISISASVPTIAALAAPVPAAAQPAHDYGGAILMLATPGSRSHGSIWNCLRPPLAAISNYVAPHLTRRIFIKKRTSPSSEVREIAELQVLMKPYTPRPASPVIRNSSTSGSSRQRAP